MLHEVVTAVATWLVIALIRRMLGLDETRDDDSSPLSEAIRILPAFSLALVFRFWLEQLAGPETEHARQLFQSVVFGIVYVVLALALIPMIARWSRAHGRARTEKVLGVIFTCCYVIPSWIQERSDERTHATHVEAAQSVTDMTASLRSRWVADIRAAGAHGPAGQTPPMLAVEDTDGGIVVSNLAGRDLCLWVARLSPASPTGVVHRCEFDQLKGRCATLRASRSLDLSGERSHCRSFPLEFRVGDLEHDEVAWWSDSALSDYEATTKRVTDWTGGAMSLAELAEETARLSTMKPGAGRAARWREDVEFWSRLHN